MERSESGNSQNSGNPNDAVLLARRRLIRAGLSSAPVMVALASPSVLATTTGSTRPTTCSAFSSVYKATKAGMKLSHKLARPTTPSCTPASTWSSCGIALLPGKCKNRETLFHCKSGSGNGTSPTWSNSPMRYESQMSRNTYGDWTIQKVCVQGSTLAKHCAAAYLNCLKDADRGVTPLVTAAQCYQIWAGNGVWSPNGSVNWTLDQTLAFFDFCFEGKDIA